MTLLLLLLFPVQTIANVLETNVAIMLDTSFAGNTCWLAAALLC